MKKRFFPILMILPVFLLVISACGRGEENAMEEGASVDSTKPQIVTSIFPMYEIVKEIAGEQADVSLMVGAGEDAHHYEPSAQAVALVSEADAFIYSSDVMEFWAESMLTVVENEDLQIVELAEGLDLSLAGAEADVHDDHDDHTHDNHDHGDHDHGGLDPHFWLDPVLVQAQLPIIVEMLAEIDPANQAVYEQNATGFSLALEELDGAFHQELDEASQRSFVVQHQAFGHLAQRYDLEQVAVGGLSTEVEPSPQDLIEIIEFINEQEVSVIFYQSGAETSIAETLANETNTEIAVLYDLENQPEDFSVTENFYLEAMYHNLEQLQRAIK